MIDNLPTTALGVLDLFSTSKDGIERFSKQVIQSVENGEVNPLRVRVYLKTLEDIIRKVNDSTKEYQLREADKHGAKSFEYLGANIEVSELGTKYDYSNCNDPVYNDLLLTLENVQKKLKERETFLKSITKQTTIVTDDGELVTLNPPGKKSTTGLKVSIK